MSDSKMPRPPTAAGGAAALHPSMKSKIQPQASTGGKAKVSAQMDAVMRLMTGREERTIADKLADSNRPSWEQFKKDNEDKLNISGLEQKKMEEYRKELDAQRDQMLARGTNHQKDKKNKKNKKRRKHSDSEESSDDYSSDESRRRRKHRKKHKQKYEKKKRKKHRRRQSSESDYSSDSDNSNRDRKHKKSKKKQEKKHRGKNGDDGSSDEKYRLSTFFTKGSGGEDSN